MKKTSSERADTNMTIHRAAEMLRVPERTVLDFSEPVNPLGVSKKVKAELRRHLKYLRHVPDPDCTRMRQHLARYLQVKPENVLSGHGKGSLLHGLIRTLRPRNVLLPVPGPRVFVRVARACSTGEQGGFFGTYPLQEENGFRANTEKLTEKMRECDMLLLSNPHDPTGSFLKREEMRALADEAARTQCTLIVDESFIEFLPGESVADLVPSTPHLIVYRTLSYFYSLPGLTTEYCVCPGHIVKSFLDRHERTDVNALGQRAAVIAIRDSAYKKETARVMTEEKRFLEKELKRLGISFFPSPVNFYLIKVRSADDLFRFLLKRRILVRTGNDLQGLGDAYIRIAVRTHRENANLIKALHAYSGKQSMSG